MSKASPGETRLPAWQPGALAPVLACAVVFLFLALQVMLQGPLTRVDQELTLFLAVRREEWLTRLMLFFADGHDTVKVLAATVLLAMWRFWRRDLRAVRLLAVVPAGMLLNVVLKHLFQRPRPVLEEPLVHLSTYSFPSGHAVAATLFYGALCALVFARTRSRTWRAAAVLAAMAMVVLVSFSRVYLGAHYLSDVIAGAAEGLACLLLLRYARR